VILLFPFVGMSLRWRSFRLGLYSVAAGNAVALCFWPGLLRPRIAPASWIESTVVQRADRERATARPAFKKAHADQIEHFEAAD
jgi:hypothetical protein